MEFLYKLLSDSFKDRRQLHTMLLTLLALAFYPFYLLTSYMSHKGFYAYEVFAGVFGLVVPFLFMAFIVGILLLFLVFVFWAWVIVLIGGLAKVPARKIGESEAKPEDAAENKSVTTTSVLKESAGVFVVNAFFLGLMSYAFYKHGDVPRAIWLVAAGSFVLAAILGIAQITSGPQRLGLYIALFFLGLFVPIFGREDTSSAIEGTLGQFRLGGVMVTIVGNEAGPGVESSKSNSLYGRLVFLSSSNVYLETGCPRKSVIVPRKDSLRLEFAELRSAGLKEFECPEPGATKGKGS